MWKWLHSYADPERAYKLSGTLLPWFSTLAILLVGTGSIWGLLFAPTDYQQGDSYRIIFIHVPAASMSMAAYMGMAIASFIGLVWQIKSADWAAAVIAGILAIVGVINIPIIKYSVDWWSSLHQPSTIKITEKSTMSTDMLYPLLINIFGFGMMIGAITLIRYRTEILARNGMRPWVRDLATAEEAK